jgi:hypothetical protein
MCGCFGNMCYFYFCVLYFLYCVSALHPLSTFALYPLTTTIVAPPRNASKWQMGFNSAFKVFMSVLSVLV